MLTTLRRDAYYMHVMKHASFEYRQKIRLKAAALFAEGKHSNSEMAHRLGVSRKTMSQWHQAWVKDRDAGLVIGTPGRRPGLDDEQWQRVQQALLEGPRAHGYDTDLWTLERMAGLIEKITCVRYHPNSVWRLLKRLKWSCQRPRRLAKERNEEAITSFKEKQWPQIKKGHKTAEQPLSS